MLKSSCDHEVKAGEYSLSAGFIHLGAGLACGLTGLAAGYAIGYVGDSVRSSFTFIFTIHLNVFLIVCSSICSRIEGLRDHGPYPHFWRGPGPVRVRMYSSYICVLLADIPQPYCCANHEHQSNRNTQMLLDISIPPHRNPTLHTSSFNHPTSLSYAEAINTNTFVDTFMTYRSFQIEKICYGKERRSKCIVLYFLPLDSTELERLRRLGTRRFLSRSRDLEDSDSDPDDDESESDDADESLSLSPSDELDEPESESDVERLLQVFNAKSINALKGREATYRLLRFLLCESAFSFSFPLPLSSFNRSFSFASRILFAVPTL